MTKENAFNGAGDSLRQKITLKMQDCSRFDICNANICPLDDDWRKRTNQKEDPTCFYLSESVKMGAKAIFEERGLENLFERMEVIAPAISAKHARIKNTLERAKRSGSRMLNGLRLAHKPSLTDDGQRDILLLSRKLS